MTSTSNGSFTFTVSDLVAETVTFTATDSSQGVVLKQTAKLAFVTPPSTGAGLDVFPSSVTANGKSNPPPRYFLPRRLALVSYRVISR